MRHILIPIAIAVAAASAATTQGTARNTLAAASVTSDQQGPDGRVLYLKNCRQCHSPTGEPSAETKHKYAKIKSLNDSAFLASLSDDSILHVIKNGAGRDMKAFGDRLTAEEMVAVVKYVRTLPSKTPVKKD